MLSTQGTELSPKLVTAGLFSFQGGPGHSLHLAAQLPAERSILQGRPSLGCPDKLYLTTSETPSSDSLSQLLLILNVLKVFAST